MAAEWAERAAAMTPSTHRADWTARVGRAGRWFADAGEIGRARALLEGSLDAMPPGDGRAAAMLTLAQIEGWDEGGAAVIRRIEQALGEATDPDLRARLRLGIAVEPDIAGVARAIAETEMAIAELTGSARRTRSGPSRRVPISSRRRFGSPPGSPSIGRRSSRRSHCSTNSRVEVPMATSERRACVPTRWSGSGGWTLTNSSGRMPIKSGT